MDWLHLTFSVSGVRTSLWLPPLAGFAVSFFTSMVGVFGAFLLLPFQMSVLGYTMPSVSATNLVFNLVSTPSGVYRYITERRMLWPLTWLIASGTPPGIAIGYYIQVRYLHDPQTFKQFVGAVLLYMAYRVLAEFLPWRSRRPDTPMLVGAAALRMLSVPLANVRFEFQGDTYEFSTCAMLVLALAVGVIGGIYGIGGGAIIAPFCITLFRLRVYVVAGPALAGRGCGYRFSPD